MIVSGVTVVHAGTFDPEFVQVVALSGGVGMRLLGISIASFSSGPFKRVSVRLWLKDNCGLGLGELTFLQLSTTYLPVAAGRSVGCVLLQSLRHAGSERLRI